MLKIKWESELINSICVAIFLNANALCWIVPFSGAIILVMAVVSLLAISVMKRASLTRFVPLYLLCLTYFAFTYLFFGSSEDLTYYLMDFLIYATLGFYLSQTDFNERTVLFVSCLISIPLIPVIMRMNVAEADDVGMRMSVSYGTLNLLLSLICTTLCYKVKDTKWFLLFLLSNLFYLFFYVNYASRGAVIAILVFFLLYYFVKRNMRPQKVLLVTLLVGVLFISFFGNIMDWISNIFAEYGINITAIDKTIEMMETGDVTNGREDITKDSYRLIQNSPIFGNGIAAYSRVFGNGYPHNVFIQQLMEGGLFLFVPFTYITIKALHFSFDRKFPSDKRIFIIFLFSTSLCSLLFSNYFWGAQKYWFFIGYIITLIYNNKRYVSINRNT